MRSSFEPRSAEPGTWGRSRRLKGNRPRQTNGNGAMATQLQEGTELQEATGMRSRAHPVDFHEVRGMRGYVLRRLLAVADVLALVAALVVMIAAREIDGRPAIVPLDLTLFVILLPLWFLVGTLLKLYHVGDRSLDYSLADQVGPVFLVATVWNWTWLLARTVVGSGPVEVMPSIVLWAASIVLVLAFRQVTIVLARRSRWYRQRVLLIGSREDVARVVRRIDRHPEYGLDIVGIGSPTEDDSQRAGPEAAESEPIHVSVREAAELATKAEEVGASRVIIASAPEGLEARSVLIRDLIDIGVQVDLVSGDPDLCSSSAAALHYLEGLPILTVPSVQVPRTWGAVKRTFDLIGAGVGLLLLLPALVVFAVRVRLSSPGPILFRQRRIGRHGRPFELLKLRTMVDGADQMKPRIAELNMHARGGTQRSMFKVPSDPRVTRFGAFLRRWSLDELPQLWNVLKGEMSLVGPRPLIPEEAELVEDRYEVRLVMRPGITGPWQTLGRSDIGFEDMLRLDYTYVMNWTLTEDVKLLMRTVGAVAWAKGAY
jgi:exopolysaccharide biosynthesis polyprenyl glycosylphosphotransferase